MVFRLLAVLACAREGLREILFRLYIDGLCALPLVPWSSARKKHFPGEALAEAADGVYADEGWPQSESNAIWDEANRRCGV